MKWELRPPQSGDMIRVDFYGFYHYGIYVSDDEIIQFGNHPSLNAGKEECDIKVLATDAGTFCCGGFLQTAVLDKKEQKARRTAERTVEYARSKIGEGGYSLTDNNCEHFAYLCVFDKAKSTQTEEVKRAIRILPLLNVFVAEIPKNGEVGECYPPERNAEIRCCQSKDAAIEKFYVWKLLRYALSKTFNKNMEDIRFEKTPYGKWKCSYCEFSLSHSDGAVAVAVSWRNVGVDIELKRDMREGIEEKMLSASEIKEFNSVPTIEKNDFLLKKWTQKESVFKTMNKSGFVIKDVVCKNVSTEQVTVGGKEYYLSVASPDLKKLRIFLNIDLYTV